MAFWSKISAFIFGNPGPTLTEDERIVLEVLGPMGGDFMDEWRALKFADIDGQLKIGRERVRSACRSLAGKGLAAFERQTWTEEGELYGAGYRATAAGRRVVETGTKTPARNPVFDRWKNDPETGWPVIP